MNPPHVFTGSDCKTSSGTYAHEREHECVRIVQQLFGAVPARVEAKVVGAAGAVSPLGRELDLVLGPPGTGKTTRLLNLLHAELERGTSVEQIAFVSFTRAARQEACARVRRNLLPVPDEDEPRPVRVTLSGGRSQPRAA